LTHFFDANYAGYYDFTNPQETKKGLDIRKYLTLFYRIRDLANFENLLNLEPPY